MALSKKTLIHMFETMNRIRLFEQQLQEFFAAGEIPGFVHLYLGEEAVATGACSALTETDMMTSTHRGHGHLLAKGGDLKLMMAEIFGRQTGYCKGKGGSMHIADLDLGILGANGIVGGGGPLAVGAAFAAKYKKSDQVALCFFGDGASNQGTTQEALNMASAWKLPLVFVNENNGYGISCPQCKSMAVVDIADRAAAYDMPGVVVDGNDVLAVHEAVSEAVKRARNGEGPSLIECKTYRWRGHFEGDACVYRCAEELEEWMAKDPIPRFEAKLLESKTLSKKDVAAIKERIAKDVDEAVAFAKESPMPQTSALMDDVYA
ncbi:pyruvate dehydrogenase (acetyl-transferring) E1 component subunit alpha [Pseudodesulfovibrio sp. JC047]|uniref:thiamine pyrophosphate-dependent dehydrogenase E1 component subunit alpha n=1 Tax=Pseudodesulfovibrio sp. JC047 TaxID=2683199 RepID=UPI0013D29107|nr:thiamine pyrophosphate-dependent dehydrogenase E1 component subunit alpha [Pseudodesulfovibrio sp. JC047]NDV19463.1 pyruvate dehydrogenase (acetyl-transferring) E1 component subunit alpha [Pseudodesulfovibrio sp. JC047]